MYAELKKKKLIVIFFIFVAMTTTNNVCLVAFVVYDVNGDGYISKEDMFPMLKASLVKMPTEEDPEEGIKDLLDLVLKKMV